MQRPVSDEVICAPEVRSAVRAAPPARLVFVVLPVPDLARPATFSHAPPAQTCQLEAIETLIWLAEAPAAEKVGIEIPSDGGDLARLCSKTATGTGKTIVMAMLIAWRSLNRINYPTKNGFAKDFLIVAPNLTVRSRLSVLQPSGAGNYYDLFGVVPPSSREQLRQTKIVVCNRHALAWDTEDKIKRRRSVDKRGAKSDEAYAREVLGELANSKNFVVINDEAHHTWRIPAGAKLSRDEKREAEEATI